MRYLLKFCLLLSIGLLLAGCATTRPPIFVPQQQPPIAPAPPPRVTLVLGGGGARSFAHIGVLKVLQQNQIPVDMIVSTDSGSIFGALYTDNNNLPRLQRILLNAELSDLIDISTLHLLEGPITGDALQTFLLTHMRARYFHELPIRLVTVATDLANGQSIGLASGPIAPAVNASAALPPYFRPVNLYGHTFVDGYIADPIPVDVAETYAPKIIIAVNITPNLLAQMPTNIIGVYDRGIAISDRAFNNYSAQNANVIIHPSIQPIDYPNRYQKLAMIQAGEIATQQALPQICALLQQNNIASSCSQVKPPSQPSKLKTKLKKLFHLRSKTS